MAGYLDRASGPCDRTRVRDVIDDPDTSQKLRLPGDGATPFAGVHERIGDLSPVVALVPTTHQR